MWRWIARWFRRRQIDREMVQCAIDHEKARIRTSDDWRDRELRP